MKSVLIVLAILLSMAAAVPNRLVPLHLPQRPANCLKNNFYLLKFRPLLFLLQWPVTRPALRASY